MPPAKLIDEILARGQGNPFFTAELVAAHLSGQAIPAVLSDLIATELEGLDAISRSVVGVIAVVGHDTAHDLLMRVAEVDADTLEVALHAAIDAQLVVVDRDTDAYRFRHALIGEVVYDELLPPERKRLHRRIADALADQPPHLLSRADRASELAFHLDRAGDHAAAFAALLLAADAAETVAPAAALRHLERALELWDSAGEASAAANRGDRLWQAAELASGAAGNERAADLAREAFRYGAPPRGAAWGHERLGRYLWAAGHIEDCAAEFAAAAALLPDDAGPDAAPVFAGLGQAELMLGHYDAAEARAQSVFDLLSDAEADPLAWAMARRVLGIVVDHGGDPARGVDLCREAVEAAPSALTRMLAVLYLGVALLDAGAYQEAVNEMLDAAAEARLTGLDRSFGGYLDALAAEGLIRLGRWSEADTILDHSEGTEAFPLGEHAPRARRRRARVAPRRPRPRPRAARRGRGATRRSLSSLVPRSRRRRGRISRSASGPRRPTVAERALAGDATALWQARFVMYGTVAEVELALDARARREPVDPDATAARLRGRIDAARVAAVSRPGDRGGTRQRRAPRPRGRRSHSSPRLRSRRLGGGGAPLGAPRRSVLAGDGTRSRGRSRRCRRSDRTSGRGAARGTSARGPTSPPNCLLTDIEAVSRRTRLSVERAGRAQFSRRARSISSASPPREAEVLSLVAAGQTNRQIGEALFVSEKTASVHVSNILRKLGVSSRVDAAAVAQRLGVT